jgi:hypothetical protein
VLHGGLEALAAAASANLCTQGFCGICLLLWG